MEVLAILNHCGVVLSHLQRPVCVQPYLNNVSSYNNNAQYYVNKVASYENNGQCYINTTVPNLYFKVLYSAVSMKLVLECIYTLQMHRRTKPNKRVRGKRAGRRKQRHIPVITSNLSQGNQSKVERGVVKTNLVKMLPQHTSTHPKLKFLSLNAQSCRNKTIEIHDLILESNCDMLFITETWLKASGDEPIVTELVPSGYKILTKSRAHRSGGGVAIIYRDHFDILTSVDISSRFSSFESCSMRVKVNNFALFCSCVYRPPPSKRNPTPISTFFQEFSEYLDLLNNEGNLYILGDFNFHFEKVSDVNVRKLSSLLDEHNLVQLVDTPTHSKNHILDLLITRSDSHSVLQIDVTDMCLSDHKTIAFEIDVLKQSPPRQVVKVRPIKNINMDVFKSELNTALSLSMHKDIDTFNAILCGTLDRHAPLCEQRIPNRPAAPWITPEVKAAKGQRRKAERLWKKTGLTVHKDIYRVHRKKCVDLIKNQKKKHLNESIAGSGSSKDLFKVCNQLLGKKAEQILPTNISLSNVPSHFNKFFIQKIESLREKMDCFQTLPIYKEFCGDVLKHFSPVTEDFVKKIILESPKKFCQLDPLPPKLFTDCIDILLPCITSIINVSLQEGTVPESMKDAIVRPLLKKASLDRNVLKNYRPVSNLPFISKILEKVVLCQLKTHLVANGLQEKYQSAYKPKHSTETALQKVTSDLLMASDEGNVSVLALLDLSAAFDTLDHDILLTRLSTTYGISNTALKWFSSYISRRSQRVIIKDLESEPAILKFGVPQGSVLGPILFSLYSQPLRDILVKHGFNFHFYADDTQLYKSVKVYDINSLCLSLNNCVSDVSVWMSANKLVLNQDKTEVMLFGTPSKVKSVDISTIELCGESINVKSSVRNLGAHLDSSLSMEQHISQLRKTCYLELRRISQVRQYLTPESANRLVCSLITSRIDYCNSLFGGIPDTQLKKIQQIQNNAARLVMRIPKQEHITPVLESLHWLPVHLRIEYKIATIAHQCLYEPSYPEYMKDLVSLYLPTRSLRSTSKSLIAQPKTKLKNYGRRAFSSQAATVWNNLPQECRDIPSLSAFKKQLKTHLFRKYFN